VATAEPVTALAYPDPKTPITTSLPPGYPLATLVPEPTLTPLPSPTSDPLLGQVRGVLLLRGKPIANYPIYLAELLKSDVGEEGIIALDLASSPWGYTGLDGSFQIINVAPGRYGLVIVTVKDSYHLYYPDRAESVIVTVTEGGLMDLGRLDYQELPIPNP